MNTPPGKKRITDKKLKNSIIPYSPKKKNANWSDEYSVLKPETNSLSPSAKSKGARFNSAIHFIIQIRNKGKTKIPTLKPLLKNKFKFKENLKQQGNNIIKIKLIS